MFYAFYQMNLIYGRIFYTHFFFTNNSLAVRNAHFEMLDGSGERLFGFQAVFTIFAGRRETICLEGKRGRAIYISIFKTMREKDMRVLVFKIPSIFN